MELLFWTFMMAIFCFALAIGGLICNAIVWFTDRRRPMATYRRARS